MKKHTRLKRVAGLDSTGPAFGGFKGRRVWGRCPKQGCQKMRGKGSLHIEVLAQDMRVDALHSLRSAHGWERITARRQEAVGRMAAWLAREKNKSKTEHLELWLRADGSYTPDFMQREKRMGLCA